VLECVLPSNIWPRHLSIWVSMFSMPQKGSNRL
jgi:hypothetical protein